ncbi:hypothetical protein [uncultured Sphingomonas sp.]|uniref:hypothetical protein n=1 Tax=uncultured Sphingomonas sp. TaxID=158754 RepID=UPI0025FEEC76|nr:hypothetical protein [uncultured Sphingomonas sp.]
MLVIVAIMMAAQADGFTCFNTGDAQTCRSIDGSTYVERRLGEQVVRQGTDADGRSWSEYERRVFDGTRTEGSDSAGRTWASQCSPRSGTTGIGRDGQPIFIPPRPPRPTTPTNGQAVAGTTERESVCG